ncbi:metallophosphoesterase [Salirhabdus salicampi]|uniref:metallophosphoesterase n=1 Tax=Salirhabdus salicampi TaxID=476102 RepID=UPI0020C5ACCD|nr:metallophosphoesterase [Salirhabdus salicampi]MCP8616726.1 metallophosphoesterase family protein [Salirhabdus salicampi]
MLTIFLLFIIIGVSVIFYMFRRAHHDVLDIRTIKDPHFPVEQGLTIFFISDVHRRLIQQNTLIQVKRKHIDLVLIGGDLWEQGVPLEQVEKNIISLKELRAPIYFVWGNNDYEAKYQDLDALLMKHRVHALTNDLVQFEMENKRISLVGLDCLKYRSAQPNEPYSRIGDYVILAAHDPSAFDILSDQQKSKTNVMFSGHTHGGQIRLFGWGLYPKGGLRKKGNTYMFVSEGYGTTNLPLRLGTNAECHVFHLQKEK